MFGRFFLVVGILFSTTAIAVDFRWTVGFAQGTVIARIQNENDTSVSIYCPSGQQDTTPGMELSFKSKRISPQPGDRVAIQVIIDGVNYPFISGPNNFDTDLTFQAAGRAARQDLENIVHALIRSRQKTFLIEFPKYRYSENFSLLDARRALVDRRGTILNEC